MEFVKELDFIKDKKTMVFNITKQEFLETVALNYSRVFGLCDESGQNKASCLIPFADMFNHRYPAQTNWTYDQERKGFIVTALKDIKRGEEVTLQYDTDISNTNIFNNYGFV